MTMAHNTSKFQSMRFSLKRSEGDIAMAPEAQNNQLNRLVLSLVAINYQTTSAV